ncbi:MAG: hypothetical protein WA004_01430 [Saprospiraceae bacterium]
MKKLDRSYFEALEELELYRLKDKYESLGYEFLQELEGIEEAVEPDAVARHKQTGELIFFEVKSFSKTKRFKKWRFTKQLEGLKKIYPGARFLLVIPRPRLKEEFYLQGLDKFLLEILKSKYEIKFRSKVSGLNRFESVEDLSISKLVVHSNNIEVEGFGNVTFLYEREDSEVFSSISDGVPFKFELSSPYFLQDFPFWFPYFERIPFEDIIQYFKYDLSFDYSEFLT